MLHWSCENIKTNLQVNTLPKQSDTSAFNHLMETDDLSSLSSSHIYCCCNGDSVWLPEWKLPNFNYICKVTLQHTKSQQLWLFSTTDMWQKDKKQKAELHISMAMSLFDLSSDIWAKALPILCLWIIAQVIIYIFLYYATYVCTMQVNLYTEKVKSFFFIPHPIVFKATFTHLVWVIHTHFHVRWYNQWKI